MGIVKRILGIESCNGMFTYPIFMGRKQKLEALDNMIMIMKERSKKKECDICKRKFTKKMSRWSKDDLNSLICIICHKKFWNMEYKEYTPNQITELKELIKNDKMIKPKSI